MRPSTLLPLLALLAASPVAAAPAAGRDFEFAKLNRGYKNLMAEAPEYKNGSLSVRLSSPRQALIVKSHRLHLEPLGDGTFRATLGIEFYGNGWLVADVAYGSVAQKLEDQLFVPPQKIEVPARVRVEREAGGYRFRASELPKQVTVEIHSRLASQIVGLCDGAAILALGQLDCSGVERSLTRVAVPLPGPGGEFFLGNDEIGTEERAALESLLAGRR